MIDIMKQPKQIVINGEWDGEPIWREKTAEDRLAEILAENAYKVAKCPKCGGSGIIAQPNGGDDFDLVECKCKQ